MKMVNFTGQDAIDVALASNKQPESFDGKAWRPTLMWRAAAIASRTPELLRLRGPARTVAEAVLGVALPTTPGLGMAEQVRAAHEATPEPTKTQTVRAIALILNVLEDVNA